MEALDAWELADPAGALRFHATRQAYAGTQMARCHASRFVRFPYGRDTLPDYQAIQADAYRKMVALRALLPHPR